MISPADARVGNSMEGLYSRYIGTEGQLKVTTTRKQVSQKCSRIKQSSAIEQCSSAVDEANSSVKEDLGL